MKAFYPIIFVVCLSWPSLFLSGCATTIRGANTDFTIQSLQDNVSVLLDLETEESVNAYDWRTRRDAFENANVASPDFEHHGCDSLPCTLNIPRKKPFSVLAYKDGYKPIIFEVAQVHKSQYNKLTAAGAVSAASVTAGAGVIVGSNIASGFGLASSGSVASATAAAQVLVLAFPATFFLAGSYVVDKDNMANFDFYPNPLIFDLEPLGPDDQNIDIEQLVAEFNRIRAENSLDPQKTGMCYYKSTRMSCDRLKRLERVRKITGR